MGEQRYLEVPFAEKEQAKAIGARWDRAARRRYVPPEVDPMPFARWTREPLVELPGEDRQYGGNGLFVDLVPSSCFFTNVRTSVAAADWDRLRRFVYERAGRVCEICGARWDPATAAWAGDGRTRRLDAHERWSYDAVRLVQRLQRIICLCFECHQVTHYGRTSLYGDADAAFAHLARVNARPVDHPRRRSSPSRRSQAVTRRSRLHHVRTPAL
ncbi:DNA primase [bacterium]|nr:MAG: DNA primase [bacterium]